MPLKGGRGLPAPGAGGGVSASDAAAVGADGAALADGGADAETAADTDATGAGTLPLLQLLMAARMLTIPLRATMAAAASNAVFGTWTSFGGAGWEASG